MKYVAFDWKDYVMRDQMQKAFDKRHAPYTNGTTVLKGVHDPETWKIPFQRRRSKKARRKLSTEEVEPNKKSTSTAKSKNCYWDSEEGEWCEWA